MSTTYVQALSILSVRCSEFVSTGVPLFRTIDTDDWFRRIKLRQRKDVDVPALNESVGQTITHRLLEASTTGGSHYVFPTNGYSCVWTPAAVTPTTLDRPAPFRHGDLLKASLAGRGVVIYGIPDFYIVRVDACSDYSTLCEAIISSGFVPTHTD